MITFRDPFEWQETFGRYLLSVQTGSYCSFDQQVTNGLHLHDYFEICLITSGTGTYSYDGARYPLTAGDVILARPGDLHEISSHQTRDLELVFFSFDIQGGPFTATEGEREILVHQIHSSKAVHVGGQRRLLGYLQILGRDLAPNWILTRTLGTFFTELLSTLAPTGVAEPASPQKTLVSRAIDIIDQHIREPLTVPEVAQYAGLSERSLRRYFKQVLRKSVVEVIRERKLNRASALLLMSFDVGSVSRMLSMEPSHFSRVFKRQFGSSPRAYQEAYRVRSPSSRSTFHRLPQG
jgi:AraC-like DNA-binding protein/quercetin dioxygenase-like cupin family protein